MRLHPTHAVLLLCLAGCATTQESSQIAQKPSTFTEQTDADTILDSAPAPLPIRAVPNQRLPIQAMTNADPDLNSAGPLAGIITKAPAGLPIVAVGANQTTVAIVPASPQDRALVSHVQGSWLGVKVTPLAQVATLPPAFPAKASLFDANSKADWVLKASYSTLEEALEDFAKRVNYEVVYEAREFPLGLKRDITIARGASFWEVLRVLGETYRKSDGAFQILPTKFNQIVVLPMGQNTANGQR